MRQLSRKEKDKILLRLCWDTNLKPHDLFGFINEEGEVPEGYNQINFYCRLLSSCDWYTLLKLIPLRKIEKILNDTVIDRLYPKDLKDRFLYAREILSR